MSYPFSLKWTLVALAAVCITLAARFAWMFYVAYRLRNRLN